jgi:hypothetical protein
MSALPVLVRHPDSDLLPNTAIVVISTEERGVVICTGRDKMTGERLVCVELCSRQGAEWWGFYPPEDLVPANQPR